VRGAGSASEGAAMSTPQAIAFVLVVVTLWEIFERANGREG
jgi:hypothetical protein